MMNNKSGTVLPPNECALVTKADMTQLQLLVPDLPDGTPMPPLVAYLFACHARHQTDPQFVRDQIRWFESWE